MAADHRLMTYAEASKALGIKVDSVKRRARNRKWLRQKSNSGLMLVGVPLDIIPEDVPKDVQADIPADNPDINLMMENAELKAENRLLREVAVKDAAALADVKTDRDAWREQAQKRSWWPFR